MKLKIGYAHKHSAFTVQPGSRLHWLVPAATTSGLIPLCKVKRGPKIWYGQPGDFRRDVDCKACLKANEAGK